MQLGLGWLFYNDRLALEWFATATNYEMDFVRIGGESGRADGTISPLGPNLSLHFLNRHQGAWPNKKHCRS